MRFYVAFIFDLIAVFSFLSIFLGKSKISEIMDAEKEKFVNEPNFFKKIAKIIIFPFIFVFNYFKDWLSWILFISFMLLVGIEVWLPILIGLISSNQELVKFGISCEMFWLAGGTPFLAICIGLTVISKEFIDKLAKRR